MVKSRQSADGRDLERERKALDAVRERMKNDPAYAMEVARKAGIVTKAGKLAPLYRKQK